MTTTSLIQRASITVHGTVQGVGFRPFVYKLAKSLGLTGWVCNTGNGVIIEIEGEEEHILRFKERLTAEMPPLAHISDISSERQIPTGDDDFTIKHSDNQSGVHTAIPPDIATCSDCHDDMTTPGNRRFGYPFTNCTNCGPRFTIIESVPYDRPFTTMASFEMCTECRHEYEDPMDRRFHAQPNACPVCGPHLALDGRTGINDLATIWETTQMLRNGDIVAIKGLGGYHLACDASNTQAVDELRRRKGRGGKPFALMCSNLDEAHCICIFDDASAKLLTSTESPIVLLPKRPNLLISPSVAPGVDSLGVMLPYTPLHLLLMLEFGHALVMTSGNISEEPIICDDAEAIERLDSIADHILSHNRPIHISCDDSIAKVINGSPVVLRRARGYVPKPIEMLSEMPQILACGGDLKNTFCLTKDKLALISQHMGDLENVSSMQHYQDAIKHFTNFFDVKPEVIAHDLHPGYHSTEYALSINEPVHVGIQHHHAHIASCMAENHITDQVIGVALDGTGYGTDGNIWGSEFMIADYNDFKRVAHLAYVPLPGSESAIRRPGRMALAYLLQADETLPNESIHEILPTLSIDEITIVRQQITRHLNSPLTSSMGRLFDAISALLGVCDDVTYEGQAAIELERISCLDSGKVYQYNLNKRDDDGIEIDVRPMIREVVTDIKNGVEKSTISGMFHSTIADVILNVCILQRDTSGLNRAALSGGVFQNAVLLEKSITKLETAGFEVFTHSNVPTNDGGISLGQAMIAAERYRKSCV
ncbi:MAG: carbamoyltransferase HypF [Armatimonadota bacterium]